MILILCAVAILIYVAYGLKSPRKLEDLSREERFIALSLVGDKTRRLYLRSLD